MTENGKIKEIIIVEGRNDEAAVKAACNADTIATGGFGTGEDVFMLIERAYARRGILILTDPDYAGEKIRNRLKRRFPNAKHAWIPRDEATKKGDIGIENASSEAIRAAIINARTSTVSVSTEFGQDDLIRYGMMGGERSAELRDRLGWRLGIGYGNCKTFLKRLNSYGVSREEFETAFETVALEFGITSVPGSAGRGDIMENDVDSETERLSKGGAMGSVSTKDGDDDSEAEPTTYDIADGLR